MKSNKSLSFLMWIIALSFFTYQFILRLWPSLMMNQIMQQFGLNATNFGLLASFYYYGYAGMQIPLAILLNKYGARYIISTCAFICGLANLIFIYTNNWYLALIMRFLVGAGSGAAFLGVSNIISEWFAKDQYTKMVGYSFTIGLLGAIYGGAPVSLLVDNLGWEKIGYYIGFGGMGIGFLALLILRSKSSDDGSLKTENNKISLSDIKKILCLKTLWILAIANLLMVGILEGFADVWGVNYLVTSFNLNKEIATKLISYIFKGMLFGGPILAFFGKRFGNYLVIIFAGLCMSLIFLKLLLFSSNLDYNFSAAMFFIIGILCCYQVLVFSIGANLVETSSLGVAIAFLNSINMLGGSFFHTIVGRLMDYNWSGMIDNGIRQYDLAAYQSSLLFIPICSIIGSLMIASIYLSSRTKLLKS